MRLTPGAVRLDDIIGGTLLVGTIPAPRFRRAQVTSENAGAVTVTAAAVDITTVDLGTVVAGDLILVFGQMVHLKGVTAGRTSPNLQISSGTAVLAWGNDSVFAQNNESSQGASTTDVYSIMGIARVTTGGTCVLALKGTSAGSNGTVAIGDGQLYAWVIPGS